MLSPFRQFCFFTVYFRGSISDSIAAASVRTVATTETENSNDLFHDLESYKDIQDSIVRQYPGYNPDANFHALRHPNVKPKIKNICYTFVNIDVSYLLLMACWICKYHVLAEPPDSSGGSA